MSGLGMGIKLREAGIPFVILEQSPRLGGTWWDNTYPGCACDIPSHLYAFSFAPHPGWTRVFPGQAEILAYLERLASERGLLPHIRFGTRVRAARWDEEARGWRVELESGEVVAGDVLVSAVGALNEPRYADLPGRERFAGAQFHSARWDHSVALRGRRVGVIGNAASAVQFVPVLAEQAGELLVFQRTPHWVLPRRDRAYSAAERLAFRVPPLLRLYRWLLYGYQELVFLAGFRQGSPGSRLLRRALERRIAREVRDPALRAALVPGYAPGCKRGLLADDYYPALERPNVRLVTEPLVEIRAEGPASAERTFPVDVLIHATGFDIQARGRMDVFGRGGQRLADRWGDAPRAYLGMTVPGFPNYFLLLGPGTGLGHNSVMWMVECQLEHVLQCLRLARRRGHRALEVEPAALDRYVARVARRFRGKVWSDCRSWYQNAQGDPVALWPATTARYWWETRRVDPRDYRGLA